MTNEEMWAGKLGDESTVRNKGVYTNRSGFWHYIKKTYNMQTVLEIGCNDGWKNLCWLGDKAVGLEINMRAVSIGRQGNMSIVWGKATDIPFKDNWFDLVFTAGLLIHIPQKEIKKAMREIIRVSKKYVLAIEYYSGKERERPFLGEMGITWERPYNDLYVSMGLEVVEAGFLTKEDGFNDLNYWIFKKEGITMGMI